MNLNALRGCDMNMAANAQGNGNDVIREELQANPFNLSPATSLEDVLKVIKAKNDSGKHWHEIYGLDARDQFGAEVSQ